MVLQGLVMASLMIAAEPPGLVKRPPVADGRCYANTLTFQVPYHLTDAPPPTALMKPALYHSNDGGKHWKLGTIDVDGISPATFRAPADGEYWLRMGFRRLGDTTVPDFRRERDGVLVVVVDCRPPTVRFVPRLAHGAEGGPAIALKVAVEDEPLGPPDIAIEVELPATDDAPAGRHLWIDHAEVGREYCWRLSVRGASPAAFHAVAVDQAGNVGRDVLQMSLLTRQAAFKRLARPEIVRPKVVRPLAPSPETSGALAAVVEYAVQGPALGENESVELWSTDDGGRTWRACVRHEDRGRPLVFTAPRPGLYGLRLMLRRGESMVGDPPAAGTKPQTYVVMERAADDATIVGVQAAGATRLGPAAAANVPTDLSVKPQPTHPQVAPAAPSVRKGSDPKALAHAAYEKGNYFRLQGRWVEASRHFRQAVGHDPTCFDAHNDLAGCLHRLERFEEAVRSYYRAIDIRPRHPDARFSLARTLIRLGRLDEGLSQLNEVVRLNPADGEAWLYRGELLLSQRGDVAGARTSWKKALTHAPRNASWSDLARRRLAQHPVR